MKRIGYLYEKLADKKQIKTSILACAQHKMDREEVRVVMANPDFYVDQLYQMMAEGTYEPAKPRHKKIWDKCSGKERIISIIPFFPDACVQRLVVDVMNPILFRGMYPHSCASIPGRGNAHAEKYVKHALRNVKGSKYCAKLDIRHYYPSIRADLVITKLRRKIKDERFLDLVYRIITCDGEGKGLDIGFYINQWLANYLLEELDWKIASADRVLYYVRNMDDMVLIGPNKRKLRQAVDMVMEELGKMGMTLKPNYQVFQVDSRGIDFVGYRFFHGKTILRKRNSLRLMRRIRRIRKKEACGAAIPFEMAAGVLSMIGQLKHCDSCRFRNKYITGLNVGKLKRIVRNGKLNRCA